MTLAAIARFLGWRGGIAIVLGLLLAVQSHRLGNANERTEDALASLKAEQEAFRLFAERTRAKAEQITRQLAENALRVEREQTRITQEVSRDYQTRLAALRADFDRRLRTDAARRANPGGAGSDPVPGLPPGPGRPDATPAPAEFEFNCRANTIQLEELQEWVRRQARVPH